MLSEAGAIGVRVTSQGKSCPAFMQLCHNPASVYCDQSLARAASAGNAPGNELERPQEQSTIDDQVGEETTSALGELNAIDNDSSSLELLEQIVITSPCLPCEVAIKKTDFLLKISFECSQLLTRCILYSRRLV